MQSFPMFLRMTGRRVVIAGGGEQAAQKARLILKTDAAMCLAAPVLDDELTGIVRSGRATHAAGHITQATFSGCALAFIATGCAGADAALHAIAKDAGAVVNVVDRPDLCDATTPSIVDRDPVVVAIGTEGTAPVLARQIKTRIETMLPPRVGGLAAIAGRLRGAVAEKLPQNARRAFWAWAFADAPYRRHVSGDEAGAATLLKEAIASGHLPDGAGQGHIALVGAGPGARDLLTLRAVERLQEADVIFYDRLVDPDVLELARRDAERVYVGKEVGACAWPQDRICSVILAEARKGRRVVRLKSGDPSIFGRATEELEAARAAGVDIEIVPGVTAASAAAACMSQSLTERGRTDTVVFATGTCRPGDPSPDWAMHVRPGTTMAIYMGVRTAPQIRQALLSQGVDPETDVDIATEVTTARERLISTTLADLPETLRAHDVTGVSLLLIRVRKSNALVPATQNNLRAVPA